MLEAISVARRRLAGGLAVCLLVLAAISCEPAGTVDGSKSAEAVAPKPSPTQTHSNQPTRSKPSVGASGKSVPVAKQCHEAAVWEFVAEFERRFPGCKEMPERDELRGLSCPAVDMRLLASGCMPDDAYVGWRSQAVESFVEKAEHPCRKSDGSVPDDGRAHLSFKSSARNEGLRCAASDESCSVAKICKEEGRCSEFKGNCWARSDGDCQGSEGCSYDGACHAINNTCMRPCEDRLEDVDVPLFRTQLGYGPECAPFVGSAGSCQTHDACKEHGMCSKDRGFCVRASDEDCRNSPECSEEGRCVIDGYGQCNAELAPDCKASAACADEGRCYLKNNKCVSEEQAITDCEAPKQLINGGCRLPADFDCSQSELCDEHNRCDTYVEQDCDTTGVCAKPFAICVESEEYCQSQPRCAEKGICSAVGRAEYEANKCGSYLFKEGSVGENQRHVTRPCSTYTYGGCEKTEKGCANSESCKKKGGCSAASPSSYCRPTRPEHCEQSEDCERLGYCGLSATSTYKICRATEPEHCERSTRCKEEGYCHFQNGVCEKAEALE